MALVASRGLLRMVRRLYLEQDVGHCLSYGSAIASGAGYIWHIAAVEEVSQPDLFGPQLHEVSTIPLFEAYV
ncbi:hypothetical protein DM02DRAFT_616850 [Periconia macrospinosa]|uniref:Uncharacterized protein n=1 Tax=Periconia macrospinosa TaxID=97972 RepID=A0A2V1DFU0_9PLEO|nr:hypothetical protein DM02DRAFT_616850 [Periconia macrospinosa]